MSRREYHFIITVSWPAGELPAGNASSEGRITAQPGQTRQDLFEVALRHVRGLGPMPERLHVEFFSLEPNDLEAAA